LDSNTWSKRTESHGAELPTDSVAKSCREIETGQAQIIAGLQISCVATGFATTGATGLNILTLQVLQVLLLERSQRTSFMIEAGLPPTSPLHETKPNLHETRIRLKLGHYVTQGTSMTIWQHTGITSKMLTVATAMAPRRETRFPDHLGPRTI
jgi:hypothetical protein